MEKEKVLEIETQEVFDRVAVRIKYLDDDFFGKVRDLWDQRSTDENVRYNLGNYFKTLEEAEKVKVELDKFWAKVRAGEIGND